MIRIQCKKHLKGKLGDFVLEANQEFKCKQTHAIFGESGCGKSSILKMLAGILKPDSGEIQVDGQYFFDSAKNIDLEIWKRQIGFVFQSNELFPHLNVYKNITFSQRVDTKELEKIIHILELESLLQHRVSRLSGGQAQKVALARALCFKPKILLLDEPFSGLDSKGKQRLQSELKNILPQFDFTIFLISHDISDVLFLSDEIHFLKNGKLRSVKPNDLFDHEVNGLKAKVLGIIHPPRSDHTNLVVSIQDVVLNIQLKKVPETLEIGNFITLDNHFFLKDGNEIKKVE